MRGGKILISLCSRRTGDVMCSTVLRNGVGRLRNCSVRRERGAISGSEVSVCLTSGGRRYCIRMGNMALVISNRTEFPSTPARENSGRLGRLVGLGRRNVHYTMFFLVRRPTKGFFEPG